MKKYLLTYLMLLTTVIFFISCSKDNNSGINVGKGIISATINNQHINFNITDVENVRSGDSVTIIITGLSADSSKSISFNFYNIKGLKPGRNECGYSFTSGSYIAASYTTEDDALDCDGSEGNSYFNIVSYTPDESLKGTFNLYFFNNNDTASDNSILATGEFNAPFYVNATDLPIPLGKVTANIDGTINNFSVFGSKEIRDGDTNYIITGYAGQKTIVLQFINFMPESGEEYEIGNTFPSKNPNNNYAYILASYVKDSTTTYFANGLNGTSGIFQVAKATNTNIQAEFQFIGANHLLPAEKVNITDGMFNAKIKTIYKK